MTSSSETAVPVLSASGAPSGGSVPAQHHGHASPERSRERLRALLRQWRPELLVIALYAVVIGALTLVTPLAVQALVDSVAFGVLLQPVIVLTGLLVFGLSFRAVLKAFRAWVVEVLQRRYVVHVVEALANRLPRARLSRAAGHDTAIVHRFFELFTVQKSAASLLLGGFDALLAIGVGSLVLTLYHPILSSFVALLAIAVVVIVFVLGKGGVSTALEESREKYALAWLLHERLENPSLFRTEAGELALHERIDGKAGHYLNARAAHFRIVWRQLWGTLLLQVVASGALLAVGGWLVIERQLSLGQLIAAELILTGVVASLATLAKHADTYYDLLAGLEKLAPLLELELERDSGERANEVIEGPLAVELQKVGLGTPRGELLWDVNFQVLPGRKVTVRGPSGAGKSTLLRLIFGALQPDSGSVRINGVDLRDLHLPSFRSRVAIVQSPELIGGTVLDNLRLCNARATLLEIRQVLALLGLQQAIDALPNGLQTQCGPGRSPFSWGEAWRLTLARALLRRPGLLLVDAGWQSLDAVSREQVLRAITQPGAAWTLILISSDEQLELEEGYCLSGGKLRSNAERAVA